MNITNQEYTDQEILDFLNMHRHYAVIMDKARSKIGLPKKLYEINVKTYIEDIDKNQLKLYK